MTRLIILISIIAAVVGRSQAQTDTAFTYQGSLNDNGSPADGVYDLQFSLWDDESIGTQIGLTQSVLAATVSDGLFTLDLDFGADALAGNERWLQVTVEGVPLVPRQRLTATPFAVQTRGLHVNDLGRVVIAHEPTVPMQASLHIRDENTNWPSLRIGNWPGSHTTLRDPDAYTASLEKWTGSSSQIELNPLTGSGIYNTTIGIFRRTETTGYRQVRFYRGDGTSNTDAVISVDGNNSYFHRFGGNLGVGIIDPDHKLHVLSTEGTAIYADADLVGAQGTASEPTGRGLFGFATDAAGANHGVYGLTPSTAGTGVHGYATGAAGLTAGVSGRAESDQGKGVSGYAPSPSGSTFGVHGRADSTQGSGVYGHAWSLTGVNHGVFGLSESDNGFGVYGHANNPTGSNTGVYGRSESTEGFGVVGVNDSATGIASGVYGQSASELGRGVLGRNNSPTGAAYGVWGVSDSQDGRGVYGYASHGSGVTTGVRGNSASPNGYDFFAAGAGTNYGSTSSKRWKHNVRSIDDPLEKLAALRGVYFDWDEDHGGHHDLGFIAEEVGEILPEIVNYEEDGEYAIGLDYSKMTPLLVAATNELREEKDAEIEEIRGTLETQRREFELENKALRARLLEIERLLTSQGPQINE